MTHKKNLHICRDRLSELDAQRLRRRYEKRNEEPRGIDAFHIALLNAKKWPLGKTLRCRFMDGPTSVQERVIQKARKWMDHANVRFEFVTSGSAEIRISFIADADSWSVLGNDALGVKESEPTMNFGWLDVGTSDEEYERVVLHEFGHALGCIHEHQNPEGGIPWNRKAVIEYYSGPPNNWPLIDIEANLFYRYSKESTTRTAVDPFSIMMYPIPAEHMINKPAIQGGNTLSQSDIDFIKRIYPPAPSTPKVLVVGAAAAPADIGKVGEVDEYTFTVQQQAVHRVFTEGPTDMALMVFGPNDTTRLLGQNDDISATNLNARVEKILTPGTYLVRACHFNNTATGSYRVGVSKL